MIYIFSNRRNRFVLKGEVFEGGSGNFTSSTRPALTKQPSFARYDAMTQPWMLDLAWTMVFYLSKYGSTYIVVGCCRLVKHKEVNR